MKMIFLVWLSPSESITILFVLYFLKMRKKFAKKKKNAVMKVRILFLTKVISVAMIVR
jgi:hypothetical protein